MTFFFVFSSHFNRDKGLDTGRLTLNSLDKGTIQVWIASSSYEQKQYAESFHERGGFLPPQYRCQGLTNYFVKTAPISLERTRGVRGNFYPILPYEVKTDAGGKRSDFGIHLDADYPGSLGCIVMSKFRFEEFEKGMLELREQKLNLVPLFVQYS